MANNNFTGIVNIPTQIPVIDVAYLTASNATIDDIIVNKLTTTSIIRKVKIIEDTYTLTPDDSGKSLYFNNLTGDIYYIYLPLASTSSGYKFHLILNTPSLDSNVRFKTQSPDKVQGTVMGNNDIGGGTPYGTDFPYNTDCVAVTVGRGGDYLEFNCDGVGWFVDGVFGELTNC
jgi:hypothetical protein